MRKGNASPKGNLKRSQPAFLEKETDSVSGSEKFQPWEGLSLRTGQEPHLLWEKRDCFCFISGEMTVVLKSKLWAWLFQNTERAGGVGSIPGEETVSLEAWRPQASSIPGHSGDWKFAVFGVHSEEGCLWDCWGGPLRSAAVQQCGEARARSGVNRSRGDVPGFQWLGLRAFIAVGPGSTPGPGTEILQATWCGQIIIINK